MDDLLENCSKLYKAELSEFPNSIIIKGNLAASTGYYIKITDKFCNAYVTVLTQSDGSGVLIMPVPISFPTGWFNRNAGQFKIEVSLANQPFTPVNFTFESVAYPGIEVQFIANDTPVNTIQ